MLDAREARQPVRRRRGRQNDRADRRRESLRNNSFEPARMQVHSDAARGARVSREVIDRGADFVLVVTVDQIQHAEFAGTTRSDGNCRIDGAGQSESNYFETTHAASWAFHHASQAAGER
jgi:hypothetical protein